MTLTEEQRAAIHAVSGLLTAIGCPQCHSYLQKNYTHHIEVLRAMIDSSDHIVEHDELIGFDLEKARDAAKFDDRMAITMFPLAIAEIERLLADLEQSERVVEARLDVIDQQAARIKELEADNQNLVTLNKSLMNNDWILRDNNRKYRKRAQKAEFLNKELKSKIGPDAKPHCWQITEERKAAIRDAEIALRDAVLDSNDPHCWDAETAVLRAMLTEAGQ
jgi:hypothetical protein